MRKPLPSRGLRQLSGCSQLIMLKFIPSLAHRLRPSKSTKSTHTAIKARKRAVAPPTSTVPGNAATLQKQHTILQKERIHTATEIKHLLGELRRRPLPGQTLQELWGLGGFICSREEGPVEQQSLCLPSSCCRIIYPRILCIYKMYKLLQFMGHKAAQS